MTERPRHLIDVGDLDDAELHALLERACDLATGATPARIGASVVNLFAEPSTRTRVSFELAAKRLGMDVVNIDLAGSSAVKGETLEDTLATFFSMGSAAVVLRQAENGRCSELAASAGRPPCLINAGEGTQAHPSQALLDAATLAARGIDFSGLRLAIVGDNPMLLADQDPE
ncbi:MAG: aspartate carbamoyltransferase catalytic subunit, partial [Wenzhouxiangella sp.]